MSMTKTDYEMVARALDGPSCELLSAGVYETVANALADNFEKDNPKFNRERFLTACGIKD